MPTLRKRASVAVPKVALDQATSLLQDLPDKPKEAYSLRETIALLQTPIKAALARGYTHEEIVKILGEEGIQITASSLKRYLVIAKQQSSTTPKARRSRKTGEEASALEEEAPALEEVEAPAPKRRGRTTPEKSSTTKTAAKAQSKPATRSTSTRRRKSAS